MLREFRKLNSITQIVFLFVLGLGLITLAIVGMGGILLSGCTAGALDEVETPVVRYVNFRVYDPVYIAIEKNFFEQYGIKVEIIGDVLGGPNAIQAVAAGSAEAGLSSVPALINANAAGLPVQGVVDVQTTLDSQSLQKWYVLNDSPLKTVNDLEGASYAINIWRSSFHYTSLLMMDENGINADNVEFRLLSFSDQIPALIEGEVDIVGLMPPYQGYMEQEYGDQVRVLWNDYDLYGSRHVSLIFVNRLWAQYNPEQAKAFVSGIVDAIDWIEQNQAEAAAIVSEYTGIPADAIGEYHYTPSGEVRPADVQAWLDYLVERGDVADWIDAEDVATNKYSE